MVAHMANLIWALLDILSVVCRHFQGVARHLNLIEETTCAVQLHEM